jgi:hypothetical protein
MSINEGLDKMEAVIDDNADASLLLPHPEFRQGISELKRRMDAMEKRMAEVEKKVV